MPYDPQLHHRRSIRLAGYDYASCGAYFVTICTAERAQSLATIEDGAATPTAVGLIVSACWRALPSFFPHVGLDAWVVMPDHMHGIVWLAGDDGNDGRGKAFAHLSTDPLAQELANALPPSPPEQGTRSGSLSAIIQNFKSTFTRRVRQRLGEPGFRLWQRNYYEHIIRAERGLDRCREYIARNPLDWAYRRSGPSFPP